MTEKHFSEGNDTENELYEKTNKSIADDFFSRIGFKGEKKKQLKILLLLLLLGIVFMSAGSCSQADSDKKETVSAEGKDFSVFDEEEKLEQKLENVLSEIKGVGNISVSVTLASGNRTEYAVNASTTVNSTTENNSDGSEKTVSQTTNNDTVVFEDNNETPVVVQETRPQVQGVLIVAEGGDDTEVASDIIQAVSALLDIPIHKITVCAQK